MTINHENEKINALLQLLSSAFTTIPFNQMLGLQLDYLDLHQVTMSFGMKQDLVGNVMQGILHGGVTASVLDMAGGMLVMASVIAKYPEYPIEELSALVSKCSTVNLHISFVNPGKGERFLAKAWMTKRGNKIAFTRMELLNQDETLIATSTGTYMVS